MNKKKFTVKFNNRIEVLFVVDSNSVDLALNHISESSPLGKALIDSRTSDISITSPVGEISMQIL